MKKIALALALFLCLPSLAGAQTRRPLEQIQEDILAATQRLQDLAAELLLPETPPEVEAGENLATALSQAAPGTTIVLSPGRVYQGNFVARQAVTLTTRGATDDPATWAEVQTPNVGAALLILGHDVTARRVKFTSAPGAVTNDLVMVGYGDSKQTTREQQPQNTTFDHVQILGNGSTKRGLAYQGVNGKVLYSQILNIARWGQDSSGIGMWNGEGPLTIQFSTIEAASENILLGGSQVYIPGLIPHDILIEDSVLTKNPAWRGAGMSVKNVFELKTGQNVTVRRSTLEYTWADGQAGTCIVLTPVPYGVPETALRNIVFEDNIIRYCGNGVSLIGYTQHSTMTTGQSQNIVFRRNLMQISRAQYGGHGSAFILGIEPRDVTIERNTIEQDGDAFLRLTDLRVVLGFKFTGNLVSKAGTYGELRPSGLLRGANFAVQYPESVVQDNAFVAAHATFKANFPNNTYSATPEGLTGFGR